MSGQLELNFKSGVLRQSQELIGSMKNYIVVKVIKGGRQQTFKTEAVAGKVNKPINWNETITVPVENARDLQLEVTVMDKDMFKDDVCGVGKINVERCAMLGGEGTYQLRLYGATKEEYAGDLNFTTRFRR